MSREKGEGTSQDRQKEKGTRTVISELTCFFPVMDTTAQRHQPYLILTFPPCSRLVGFPCAKSVLWLFSGCSLSPAVFKHCIPWGEAAEPLGEKHWARSQHEARAGKDPCPLPALRAALWRAERSWLLKPVKREGKPAASSSSQQPNLYVRGKQINKQTSKQTSKPKPTNQKETTTTPHPPPPPCSGFAAC